MSVGRYFKMELTAPRTWTVFRVLGLAAGAESVAQCEHHNRRAAEQCRNGYREGHRTCMGDRTFPRW